MKNKWKICVMSGAVMVFAVLGALILAQNVMSSADGTEKEFQLVQGTREHQASGGAASQKTEEPEESGAPTAAGTAKSGGSGEEKNTANPEKESIASSAFGYEKEADTVGELAAYYAMCCQGVRYVYGGTDLPDLDGGQISAGYSFSSDKGPELVELPDEAWGDSYGVDSSGFVMKVFEKFNVKLPRAVKGQAQQGTEVKIKDIRPGDIIFYGTSDARITHCGIYVGGDRVVHASARTKAVKISDMNYRRMAKVVRVV